MNVCMLALKHGLAQLPNYRKYWSGCLRNLSTGADGTQNAVSLRGYGTHINPCNPDLIAGNFFCKA